MRHLFALPAVGVRYRDEEGDEVSLSSEEELQEAFRVVKDVLVLRLLVEPLEKTATVGWHGQKRKKVRNCDAFSVLDGVK